MLTLPSGRIVDLSTDRAKYHALRKQGPGTDATHRQLYALVDVVYRHRNDRGVAHRGWTEYDYRFSPYTLDEIAEAPDWSDADKAALWAWVGRDTQRRRIETARRRLVDNQPQLTVKESSAPGRLFSLLRERLNALPLGRATARQWRSTVVNMQGSGLRREELHWSGLQRFLDGQPPDRWLDKSQLLAAVDFGATRVALTSEQIWGADGGLCFREVARRMPHQAVYRAALKLDAGCQCVLRYQDRICNYRVGVVKAPAQDHPLALNRFWFALDPYGRAIPGGRGGGLFHTDSEAAMAAASHHARHVLGLRLGVRFHTAFDHLTLYGGSDYREWQVSLPQHQRIFFGAHHLDHNVLAHIRTTTRCDQAGRRLLFIEEVQSDWHQAGRRHGYDNQPWGVIADAPFKQEWVSLAVKLMLIRAAQNGFDGIAWPGGAIQESRYGKSLPAIRRRYDREIPALLNRLGRPFGRSVDSTRIETRDPWLTLVKNRDRWGVSGGSGKFRTRDRYRNREEAMRVLARHSRAILLEVPVFPIDDTLCRQIAGQGLPLYGETFV